VEGSDLSHLLHDRHAISIAETIDIGEAIADALAALNAVGIVHRDVKPANVLMDRAGNIKLGDFGIAKIIGYGTVTVSGSSAMTLAYAAPEVWDDANGAYGRPSHKSDLYALGTLLYECLAGQTPFTGSFGALYVAHRERQPDLTRLPQGTPASLVSLIKRSLAKPPPDRPDDAAECVVMLQRARVEMLEAAGSPPAQEPKRFGNWQRGAPHATTPWAWHCTNATGQQATVEVHFARDVEYGTRLRKAVAANADLVPLGAERIVDENRLILRPGEAWTPDPGRPFYFWIAREELPRGTVTQLTVGETRRAATTLASMIEAASKHGLKLSLPRDQVSVAPGGRVTLHRPGFDSESGDPEGEALTLLLDLPLDGASRAMVSSALSLNDLVEVSDTAGTMILRRPTTDATVIQRMDPEGTVMAPRPGREAPSSPPARRNCTNCGSPLREGLLFCNDCGHPVPQQAQRTCPRCSFAITTDAPFCPRCGERLTSGAPSAAAVQSAVAGLAAVNIGLRSLDGDRGDYELIINNTGPSLLALNISAADGGAGLYFEFMPDVMVGPGITRRVPVRVSSNWTGWPKQGVMVPFTIFVSASSNDMPLRVDGELFVQGSGGASEGGSSTALIYVACIAMGLAAGLGVVVVLFR
jgi:hypothetical protein